MAKYFALVGADNEVKTVIVAEQDFIDANPADTFIHNEVPAGIGSRWVETSMEDPGGKKYAGIGHEYHEDLGTFIHKKQYPSWVRDDAMAEWKAPVAKPPGDLEYKWNETLLTWVVDLEIEKKKADKIL